MKHTGQTWHRNIKPASKYPIIFADRNTHVAQAVTRGLSEAEIEANTDLIAAAPELLAALIDCKDALAGHVAYDDTDSAECEAYHAARAAIAKAKGGGE
jgi:hypothetical protein